MNIVVTDDFKIMTNKAIVAIKDKNEKDFIAAVSYILSNLTSKEIKEYSKYLYQKLEDS